MQLKPMKDAEGMSQSTAFHMTIYRDTSDGKRLKTAKVCRLNNVVLPKALDIK